MVSKGGRFWMNAKKLEDLNVAKTNRVVVNEMEGKKRMFSARFFLLSIYQNVQCSLFLVLIVSEYLEPRYLLFSLYHVENTRSLQHMCSSEKMG